MMIPSDSCTGSSESFELCRSGVPNNVPMSKLFEGGVDGMGVKDDPPSGDRTRVESDVGSAQGSGIAGVGVEVGTVEL